MTTTAPPLIDVHNLHITTGEKILVNNINLHIAPGERVGLIGESGSGKSLTAAAIAGLLPENLTTTGTINLHGNNLLNTRHHTRTAAANIGFIFQEPMTALDPTMRVGNQIIEALQARAALNRTHARTAAIELLEEMRLPNPTHTMTAYPHQLSGGQRQRVVAAIAMAGNPDLLICDEPTTALDVTVQASVLERIVAGATQRGSAVLFISHDIAVVGTVCERLGIVGESGSGKTTLLRCLAGLQNPTSGTIRIDGEHITARPERELGFLRDRLQMVFQDPAGSLDPHMRVWQSIAEPLCARKRTLHRERVWELLEAVGLEPDAATRYPHEFSGGQRQRIAIARALAPNPTLLLADEAVSALDVTVRGHILDLLTSLADSIGFTLLFISHDLFVVQDLCERTIVMQSGHIVEDRPSTDLYHAPQHPYTQRLIASAPTITGALAGKQAADLATEPT
ncbi:ABC transporter ATP-binding protein [Dermatophilus congolensis]|uniref:ATP-binding cassette domain-containing protein n=1 Tax=Dermatophilus congolensis TaxID=1863 RepID=UPI001AAE80A3|nr:ABC transporter ATP-binding protein [Dermatophilus congolensis]MBO3189988.1 ABC transporter ATP-binding protein [Dermatophilus congolensis]